MWLCGIASELSHGLISIFTPLPSLRPWPAEMGVGSWDQVLVVAPPPHKRPVAGPRFWQACRPGINHKSVLGLTMLGLTLESP